MKIFVPTGSTQQKVCSPILFSSFIIAANLPSLHWFKQSCHKKKKAASREKSPNWQHSHSTVNTECSKEMFIQFTVDTLLLTSLSCFHDPTLKPPIRIILLKAQYQVWLYSGFSHGQLPVLLDLSTLLKTFFQRFIAAECDSKGAHLLWLHQESFALSHSCWGFCPHVEAGIALPTPLHRNDVKELMDPKNYCKIICILTVLLYCKLSHICTIFLWKLNVLP